uniref:Putative Cytochrome c1 [petC/cyc1] n=1 Tax=Magnetococcus massalia (strain MO-1) TaxID=451514 RepID=A0A1S7LLW7_MAGMO|nr:putative Cytochrome c1 [petC/cyc1] [Candidatus Magnetococcus massalia]
MNFKKAIAVSMMFLGLAAAPQVASAAGAAVAPPKLDWGHKGPFGRFDPAQMKRGAQVAVEVCLACHSIKYIKYDHLRHWGFTEDEVSEMAGNNDATKKDPMISGLAPEDAKESYGTIPPDLSLMVKARKGYENYLNAILTGYLNDEETEIVEAANEDEKIDDEEVKKLAKVFHMDPHNADAIRMAAARIGMGDNFNKYFPGHFLAMPTPMTAEQVEYADGTEATLEQEAKDVTAFLAWASEPIQEQRKATGIWVILYLVVLTAMLYMVKKRIWARLH